MIFWTDRGQDTPQDKASAKVVSERQKLRDANAGWVIRNRGHTICSECGSRRGPDGEPRYAKWSWMGKPYCTACVPHRVMPREPVPFVADENYAICAGCGGRFRPIGLRRRSKYCSNECSEETAATRERAIGLTGSGVRSPDSPPDLQTTFL